MSSPSLAQPARAVAAAATWLPRGGTLPAADWAWRHRVLCLLLALHVPVLALVALLGESPGEVLYVVVPLGALLAVAAVATSRRVRSLAAALGLLTASALTVHLFDGVGEAHFHYFVTVAVIALYQDWTVYLLAIGFVLVQHGVIAVRPDGLASDWGTAALHAAAVLAESAVLVLFWRANEVSRVQQEQLRAELTAGSASVQAQLAETDRIRADLIGTVSHEFRTPLTGIRGAALTLLKRGERLDPSSRTALLHAVLDQQERLSRLLENMLIAARATAVDPAAVTDVDAVAAEVAMLASAGRPGAGPVSVVVETGTAARIDRQALHQVLANLVDNALQHGAAGAVPLVAGGRDECGVWVTVSNEGQVLDLTAADRLFEPFTQLDSGATRDREGIGVGLYVVRRLVDVYGGSVDVRSEAGWVTVEVRLQPALPLPRAALMDQRV
ncbi:MAG: HAMP domain-containing histidine kinase [Frankiaceae bacterium]|nr:HAMP domain-containing histidine kinase [Frankiaceae bacterium]